MFCACVCLHVSQWLSSADFFLQTIYNSGSCDKCKPPLTAIFAQWSLVSVVASFWEHSALRYCMKGTKLMQIVVVIPWQCHLSEFHLSFSLILRENSLCCQGDSLHKQLKNLKYSIRHRDTIKTVLSLTAPWDFYGKGKLQNGKISFAIRHLH